MQKCQNILVIKVIECCSEPCRIHSYHTESYATALKGCVESRCSITGLVFANLVFTANGWGRTEIDAVRDCIQNFLDKRVETKPEYSARAPEPESEFHRDITDIRIELPEPFLSLFEQLFTPDTVIPNLMLA